MTVAALVLAAGLGRRFGGVKQLADLHGRPLVTYSVGLALANSCSPVVVVVGHRGDDVASLFADVDRVSTVTNNEYPSGQASSLRTGIDAIPPTAEAVLVLLGDQPYVPDAALSACLTAWTGGAQVARALYEDGPGHPVVFDRSIFPQLCEVVGDVGARRLLRRLAVVEVAVPGRRPPDVDTPEDLERIRSLHRPGPSGRLRAVDG